jgi:hypothetical protein
MINYFTRRIKISEIKIDDYIDIGGQICKILNIINENNIYKIIGEDEYGNIHNCLYDININFYKKKIFTKYNFIYKYEIWRIQDYEGDGIDTIKKYKIEDNFINYKQAELYANKYINLILDEDIAEYLDEIIIIKSTDYIDNEISKLYVKLS